MALLVFGPGAEWKELAGRLALTAYTDNQTNSYVLDRIMSTAFPASVVLMELALQLQDRQLDLDLQWIPKDQNVEADALTNEEFEMFSPENRLDAQMDELQFKILRTLMSLIKRSFRRRVPNLKQLTGTRPRNSDLHSPGDLRRGVCTRTVQPSVSQHPSEK